jgi:hypothetical protein
LLDLTDKFFIYSFSNSIGVEIHSNIPGFEINDDLLFYDSSNNMLILNESGTLEPPYDFNLLYFPKIKLKV